jgi:hypothetical protein
LDEHQDQDRQGPIGDRLTGIVVLEVIALAIALAAPITPSKTGSTWSPAELVTPDPNYVQKVLASFVVVNVIIAVLAIVVWLTVKVGSKE